MTVIVESVQHELDEVIVKKVLAARQSGAQPLRFNAYKVPLTRNLVKRAIRGVEAWTTS